MKWKNKIKRLYNNYFQKEEFERKIKYDVEANRKVADIAREDANRMKELAKLSEEKLNDRLKREEEMLNEMKVLRIEKKEANKKCQEMLDKCERIQIQCQNQFTYYDV